MHLIYAGWSHIVCLRFMVSKIVGIKPDNPGISLWWPVGISSIPGRVAGLILCLYLLPLWAPAISAQAKLPGHREGPNAEFESQGWVVLNGTELIPEHNLILNLLITAAPKQPFLVLVHDLEDLRRIQDSLDPGMPMQNVHFCLAKTDSLWIRDYGPLFVRNTSRNRTEIVDFQYSQERPNDDQVSIDWARLTRVSLQKSTLNFQGGNLVSNGAGLGLTTSKVLAENYESFLQRTEQEFTEEEVSAQITDAFKTVFRLEDLVVLEPLKNEPTQHVDMFASFIDAKTVVVAKINPALDRENAEILDRNAKRLRGLVTADGKRLEVKRLEIPGLVDSVWSTYLNILLTRDTVFVPYLPGDPPRLQDAANAFYRRHFPTKRVVMVNCETLNPLGGSLHCVTLNLPAGHRIPPSISAEMILRAKQIGELIIPDSVSPLSGTWQPQFPFRPK